MKLAIVMPPDDDVTGVITGRLLNAAAHRLGWRTQICSAQDGAAGLSELSNQSIAADSALDADVDWVVYIGQPQGDCSRYAGLPRVYAQPHDALKNPQAFLLDAQRAIEANPSAFLGAPPAMQVDAQAVSREDAAASRTSGVDVGLSAASTASASPLSNASRRAVAITACPTGVAHTFMAAEALKQAAAALGITLSVETRGSVGARNALTDEDIRSADVVLLATDIEVGVERFAGKRVYRCGTGVALKDPRGTLTRAFNDAQLLAGGSSAPTVGGSSGAAASATHSAGAHAGASVSAAGGAPAQATWGAGLYKHLLTGVSYMLPLVVAGGLLIALSFVFGIEAFKEPGTLPAALKQAGDAAFMLMIPVLAGYIAFSVADRPGLAPGMIGGALAATLGAGFIGGIVGGFLGGYSAKLVNRYIPLPPSVESLKPILIIPLLASLITGLGMIYLVGEPVAIVLRALTNFLETMGTANAVLLGVLLGAMMCVDLGGPINKAAYAFTVGLLSSSVTGPMAVTMAAGMVPPIGMALATLLARHKFDTREREAGKAAGVLGLCFISEGAIPFAAKDPLRVLPVSVAGGAVTGALVAWLGCKLVAPHGGLFVLLIPGAMNRPLAYVLAILAGSLVTAVLYALIKPRVVIDAV